MMARVPRRSGRYSAPSIFIAISAWPSGVSRIPWTEPTLTPATWTRLPLTSWPASLNRAHDVVRPAGMQQDRAHHDERRDERDDRKDLPENGRPKQGLTTPRAGPFGRRADLSVRRRPTTG